MQVLQDLHILKGMPTQKQLATQLRKIREKKAREERAETKRQSKMGRAQNVGDFRPGLDRVERRAGKTYVVDVAEKLYAPLEVRSDVMPADFVEKVQALGPERAAKMFEVIRQSPFLSEEGRRERMEALLAAGVVHLVFTEVTESPRDAFLRERAARTES